MKYLPILVLQYQLGNHYRLMRFPNFFIYILQFFFLISFFVIVKWQTINVQGFLDRYSFERRKSSGLELHFLNSINRPVWMVKSLPQIGLIYVHISIYIVLISVSNLYFYPLVDRILYFPSLKTCPGKKESNLIKLSRNQGMLFGFLSFPWNIYQKVSKLFQDSIITSPV